MSGTYPDVAWSDRLFINGALIRGAGSTITINNPATGEPILELSQASAGQVDDAVSAAKTAFDSGLWSEGVQRRDVLLRLADLLEQHQADDPSPIYQPPLWSFATISRPRYFGAESEYKF
jgi:delta 1-pyrroline-5-carboxylate dehydrogenase